MNLVMDFTEASNGLLLVRVTRCSLDPNPLMEYLRQNEKPLQTVLPDQSFIYPIVDRDLDSFLSHTTNIFGCCTLLQSVVEEILRVVGVLKQLPLGYR